MSSPSPSQPDVSVSSAEESETPQLGVHVLSEFLFCTRAGLLAWEERREDSGKELDEPNLDYLPRYDLPEIEQFLERILNDIWQDLAIGTGLLALVFLMSGQWGLGGPDGLWAALAVGVVIAPMVHHGRRVARLVVRRRQALRAEAKEPDFAESERPAVDWWELLAAGFESVAYKESLYDEDIRLGGRPWRVLRRGPLRIPVFRKRQGIARLHEQHIVRMAAYCHLLEVAEGGESPYGVILDGESYRAVALPNHDEARAALREALATARTVMTAARDRGKTPDAPGDKHLCSACPWGRPVVHRPGETETVVAGRPQRVHASSGPDGRLYHSRCGDRYGWTPPHSLAHSMRLRRG